MNPNLEQPADGGVESGVNLLPRDGVVRDFGRVIGVPEADRFMEELMRQVPWRQDEVVMFGRRVVTARKVAWFGDAPYGYSYSGGRHVALAWTPLLEELRKRVEVSCGEAFNSCLLNLYADGRQGMGWHSDDERSLGDAPVIASLSFGAERRFCFRHRTTREVLEMRLAHGSLVLMAGETQRHWQHSVPKMARVSEPRINLTFRRYMG